MIKTYKEAIEGLIDQGTITGREYADLPRCEPCEIAGLVSDRSYPIREAALPIIMDAAALASMLDDRHKDWFIAGGALEAAIAKCEDERIPVPDEIKLGLRGLAMQADFAARLMKAGGLT